MTVEPLTEQQAFFNSDLLYTEEDLEKARAAYPNLIFALHDEDLEPDFKRIDDRANKAKKRARTNGLRSVIWATLTVMLIAADPFLAPIPYADHELFREALGAIGVVTLKDAILAGAALSGLASVLYGLRTMLWWGRKRAWLEDRYRTERWRQFHFQALVALLPDIMTAASHEDAREAYHQKREGARRRAKEQIKRQVGKLKRLLEPDEICHDRFFETPLPSLPEKPRHWEEFTRAYKDLRINHQIAYARMKLNKDGKLSLNVPATQRRAFVTYGLILTLMVLGANIATPVGYFADLHPWLSWTAFFQTSYGQAAILMLALFILGVQTLQGGLQPAREVERYRQYLTQVSFVKERFEAAEDFREQLKIMYEMEEVTYWEMMNFLKTNQEAEYVI